MEKKRIAVDWVEPAHPSVLKFRDDLLAIYRVIRDKLQGRIDETFDSVSRKIGFLVTTTLPVAFQVGPDGKITGTGIGAEHFKGTLFEDAFAPMLESFAGLMSKEKVKLGAGDYSIQLLWVAALKLRLRVDWVEPAHFKWLKEADRHRIDAAQLVMGVFDPSIVDPNVMEPVHLKPSQDLWRLKVLTIVIDEVYPELRLVERIAQLKEFQRRAVGFEVMEPAHFRYLRDRLSPEVAEEIEAVLRKYGY